MKQQILHYPNLNTVLAVEEILKNSELAISKEEIKRRLPKKIMHQTLNLILEYMEQRGLVVQGSKGILWIYNPSKKLNQSILKGEEI